MVERNRRLLWLMAISNQCAENIDKAIERQPMARMLNLRDVLQLVDAGLNNRALAPHQTVIQGQQSLFDVALELSHGLTACPLEQLFGTGIRSSVLPGVSTMLSSSPRFAHSRNSAGTVHQQMQFEAKAPIDRSLAACG